MTDLTAQQRAVCSRVGAEFAPAGPTEKLGIGREARPGVFPINGLRHPPSDGTCGWFIWVGEGDPGSEGDYFAPLHVSHVRDRLPEIGAYLGLAPGWRFLIAPDYEDVWFDASLLNV